jgi:hypothetical protein
MTSVQLVTDNQMRTDDEPERNFREQPISQDWLFQSTDEAGRSGWFLRLCITGLFPRRVGPFGSKAEALGMLEKVLSTIDSQVLFEFQNVLRGESVCVIEGVPTLTAEEAIKAA